MQEMPRMLPSRVVGPPARATVVCAKESFGEEETQTVRQFLPKNDYHD